MLKYFIFLIFIHKITADYYTSVVGLENLLSLEKDFINAVENYISDVQKVRNEIKSFLSEVELEHEKIKYNPDKYYGEPTNTYQLIRRMVLDWQHYEELITMLPEYMAFNTTITQLLSKYEPFSVDDLLGAATGLQRLQHMYALNTEDLAEGFILDVKHSEGVSAHDAYVLARSLYDKAEYAFASEWFMQALQRLDNEAEDQTNNTETVPKYPFITYKEILHNLAVSLYQADNYKLAKIVNEKLLEMDPSYQDGLTDRELFDKTVKVERRLRHINPKPKKSELQTLYRQVCNGELSQTARELRLLRCRYVTKNIAFYLIGPLKMEELSHDPFVAVYYETIFDGEIEQIIDAVEKKVERSKIGSYKTSIYSEIRTSKQAWLYNETFLIKVRQRLEDITGLTLASAEPLQVVNYGIGGHYAPHYDFSQTPKEEYGDKGNRILTALFYINDVELGGSTAFPFLRIAVPPIKHSLLVWYNMHDSTELDYRTRHAGCPVLKGSKWICNEWFHVAKQEFKRPCGLQPVGDKYKYFNNIL